MNSYSRPTPNQARVQGLIVAIVLGGLFCVPYLRAVWRTYWILNDSAFTTATILEAQSHGVFKYSYSVDHRTYVGRSQLSLQDARKQPPAPLASVAVTYSRSHPSFSTLGEPALTLGPLPVFLLASIFEFLAIATVINPRGKWAFSFPIAERGRRGLRPRESRTTESRK